MAYGYEKGFVTEHDPTLRKNVNCRDCIHYDKDDYSCTKRPLYMPEDGYGFWKTCKYFDVSLYAIDQSSKEKQAGLRR